MHAVRRNRRICSLLTTSLVASVAAGCAPSLQDEDFSAALVEGALATPSAQLALVVTAVDPEEDRVQVFNRSPRALDVTLGVYSRSGYAESIGAIAALSGLWLDLPLKQSGDFVYLTVDGIPLQLIEYGEASPELPLRDYLWAGDPVPAPARGELLVPAWPVFADVPRGAYAYTPRSRDAESAIRGSVEDIDERAIATARLALTCDAEDAWSQDEIEVDADGTFKLQLPEDADHCWIRVSAPGHLELVLPFLARAGGSLNRLILVPESNEAGARVSDTRLEFPDGASLEADARDLDAAGPLTLTVVPTFLSSMWTLAPDQLRGPSVDVRGADGLAHVEFPTTAAHLFLPLDEAPDEGMLGEGEGAMIPLGARDFSVAPGAAIAGEVEATLVVHPDALEFVVSHFSGAQILPSADGTKRTVVEAAQEVEPRPISSSDCLCLPQHPAGGDGLCSFGDGQSWSVDQEGSFSMEQGTETSLEGTISREGGGAEGAPTVSLGASLARSWSTASSQALGVTVNLSGDCKIDQAKAPRLCDTTHASRDLEFARLSFRVEELDEWHWATVDGYDTNENIGPHLLHAMGQTFSNGDAGGFLGLSQIFFGTLWWDAIPSHRDHPIWVPVARGSFTYPTGCSPAATFSYTADYGACDCEDLSDADEQKSGYGMHYAPGEYARFEGGLRCAGQGILRVDGERTVEVVASSGEVLSNPIIGQRLSLLCTDKLTALTATTDGVPVQCNAACQRLDPSCAGTLLPDPAPRVIASVVPHYGQAAPGLAGDQWNRWSLHCAAEAICQCTPSGDREGEGTDPNGDPDRDNYPNNEDAEDFNAGAH